MTDDRFGYNFASIILITGLLCMSLIGFEFGFDRGMVFFIGVAIVLSIIFKEVR
jgi:hypothetical protein